LCQAEVHLDSGKGIGWRPGAYETRFFIQGLHDAEIGLVIGRSPADLFSLEGLDQMGIRHHPVIDPCLTFSGLIIQDSPKEV
jgi:hypothetical protein